MVFLEVDSKFAKIRKSEQKERVAGPKELGCFGFSQVNLRNIEGSQQSSQLQQSVAAIYIFQQGNSAVPKKMDSNTEAQQKDPKKWSRLDSKIKKNQQVDSETDADLPTVRDVCPSSGRCKARAWRCSKFLPHHTSDAVMLHLWKCLFYPGLVDFNYWTWARVSSSHNNGALARKNHNKMQIW
ncbi:hypothetical protein V8G54_009559 [Vigna mungo]|uniref:Uncharacterized protein n=1 Tax=Vigna mungo TaxID=3915 RepID=A0AAQ3S401_VIGMU